VRALLPAPARQESSPQLRARTLAFTRFVDGYYQAIRTLSRGRMTLGLTDALFKEFHALLNLLREIERGSAGLENGLKLLEAPTRKKIADLHFRDRGSRINKFRVKYLGANRRLRLSPEYPVPKALSLALTESQGVGGFDPTRPTLNSLLHAMRREAETFQAEPGEAQGTRALRLNGSSLRFIDLSPRPLASGPEAMDLHLGAVLDGIRELVSPRAAVEPIHGTLVLHDGQADVHLLGDGHNALLRFRLADPSEGGLLHFEYAEEGAAPGNRLRLRFIGQVLRGLDLPAEVMDGRYLRLRLARGSGLVSRQQVERAVPLLLRAISRTNGMNRTLQRASRWWPGRSSADQLARTFLAEGGLQLSAGEPAALGRREGGLPPPGAEQPRLSEGDATARRSHDGLRFLVHPPALAQFLPEGYPAKALPALARTLSRAGLASEGLAALASAERAAAFRKAVLEQARLAAAEVNALGAKPVVDLTRRVIALEDLGSRLEDLRLLLRWISDPSAADVTDGQLSWELHMVLKEQSVHGRALVQRAAARVGRTASHWGGRTLYVPMEGGHVVAFKFAKLSGKARSEVRNMRLARRFGLNAPVPLCLDGDHAFSSLKLPISVWEGRPYLGDHCLPYLVPRELAGDYLLYLGDPLPDAGAGGNPAGRIRETALQAIRDMLVLAANGYSHGSLAPISHSDTPWSWDYWRWSESVISPLRFGPSEINNRNAGLSYANIRLSGLADWEHLATGLNPVPQALTEWALLVARGAYRNGLSERQTVDILTEGLRLHAAGSGLERRYALDWAKADRGLSSFVRRFDLLHGLVDRLLPRSIVRLVNNDLGARSAAFAAESEPLIMQGWFVHPLVMDVIWPYAQALCGRRPLGAEQLAWRERQATQDKPQRVIWEAFIAHMPCDLAMAAVAGAGALAWDAAHPQGLASAWSLAEFHLSYSPFLLRLTRAAIASKRLRDRRLQAYWVQERPGGSVPEAAMTAGSGSLGQRS
jgi:hypothetical protein